MINRIWVVSYERVVPYRCWKLIKLPALHTCGVRNRDMSSRYLEVYSYQYSAKYFSFAQDESEYKNKVLKETIKVSVVLDLKWVDITSEF